MNKMIPSLIQHYQSLLLFLQWLKEELINITSMMLKPQHFTSLLDFFGPLNRAATAGSYFLPVSRSSLSFIYIPIST